MQNDETQKEKLNKLFNEFLNAPNEFLNVSDENDKTKVRYKRTQQIPELQDLLRRFIDKQIDLRQFRDSLQALVSRDGDPWSIRGPSFMMEVNKLRKNHDEHHPYAEDELRKLLSGLNSDNLGNRIEQFHGFLQDEKTRLRREGKHSTQTMAPGNAAFMLSMFNYWLNPEASPIIYYLTICQGIYKLIHENLLSAPAGLQDAADKSLKTYLVQSEKDHLAFQKCIKELYDAEEFLNEYPYYTASFLYWYASEIPENSSGPTTLIKEVDDTTLLSGAIDNTTLTVAEDNGSYTTSQEPLIPNLPLPAIPEELLQERIQEVQKYILLDEKIIRDIYHALLAGHVIMTGPPGTGKTELARMVPEILWGGNQPSESRFESNGHQPVADDEIPTAYTTRLVTATDDWSVRTLIGGIAPTSKNGSVAYSIQYGYLTTTILNNWAFNSSRPDEWETLKRTTIRGQSAMNPGQKQEFRGRWLVIDEFNRAPIDLALGDALTALGGSGFLRVPIEGGSAELPIPPDFRIIGTLNSFDRNYLNQISEALKRRFSFVEIAPPTRKMRIDEQAIALYKALKSIAHLSEALKITGKGKLTWSGILSIEHNPEGSYAITWVNEEWTQYTMLQTCWQLFEVIRIYRQLGTAQAISMMRHMLINGILQNHETAEDWAKALDEALCNTVADQLQVLLPDEIEALYLYLKLPHTEFAGAYNQLLANLADTPRRLRGQIASLNTITDEDGQPYLSDDQLEKLDTLDQPQVPEAVLNDLFHLKEGQLSLPMFTRRLRTFKQERGL